MRLLTVCLVAMLAFLPEPATAGGSFPGFRGDGSGRTAAKKVPLEWSPQNLAWTAKLSGYGQSAPVVYNGRVFVTASDGPNKEKNLVAAYDLATGKRLWEKELPATQKVKVSFSVSRAAPTPVVDADGLYVFFESGELAGFDHDGKQLWLRPLVKEYGEFKNGHGLGGSPAQNADTVFLVVDHQGPSYALAVDKKTGKNRWKVDRKSRTSWTSPVVVRQGQADRLVISGGGSVDVYDAATGKQLSSYTEVGNNNVPSAAVQGDRVVVGASDPPRNANRELTLKSCCCLALGADGKLSEKPLWHSDKATASFASPLIDGECVYFVNSAGVLFCLDLKTGKEHFSTRVDPCWASPLAAEGRIYLFGRNGVTTVLKAGPKLERLASNRLWEAAKADRKEKADPVKEKKPEAGRTPPQFMDPIVYGVAVVDGMAVVRTGTTLYAVGRK